MTSGFDAADHVRHRLRLADVDLRERRAVRERVLEVLPLAGGEVVDDGHLVAALEQRVDEVRSDETGAAGDECLHAAADPSYGSATYCDRKARADAVSSR